MPVRQRQMKECPICDRPYTYVECKVCRSLYTEIRIIKFCITHPKKIFLHDWKSCPNCTAPVSELREISEEEYRELLKKQDHSSDIKNIMNEIESMKITHVDPTCRGDTSIENESSVESGPIVEESNGSKGSNESESKSPFSLRNESSDKAELPLSVTVEDGTRPDEDVSLPSLCKNEKTEKEENSCSPTEKEKTEETNCDCSLGVPKTSVKCRTCSHQIPYLARIAKICRQHDRCVTLYDLMKCVVCDSQDLEEVPFIKQVETVD